MKPALALAISFAAILCAGIAPAAPPEDDPLLRPIVPDYAKRWLGHEEPVRLFGNAYLVGFAGLNVGLIRTSAGLVLIDGAVPQAVTQVEANIRELGFSIKQVKYILSTEPHYDHSGGIAALARDSGATVLAGATAVAALRQGGAEPDDPQAAFLERYPAVPKLRAVRDGETIRLGDTVITAHATPGHTAGSMSWSWRTCEGKRCATAVFASSLNPISADGYRFSDPANRGRVAMFRATFAKVRAMPCDLLVTAHPDQSGGVEKLAALRKGQRANPFLAPGACRAYADKHEALLDARLVKELAGK
ncbi:MAG: subclass B3 metallo-beta-lactamase [Sphingobium sp.]